MSEAAGLQRPAPGALPELYRRYVDRVPPGDVLETLGTQFVQTSAFLRDLPAERETFRYAEGKWSVREVVGHVVDAERLFAFRALWFARGAAGAQPGMDEKRWAEASNAHRRSLAQHLAEWKAVRTSTVALFEGMDQEALARPGEANGLEFTAGQMAWLIAGHEVHHRHVLAERYLGVG